MAAFFPQRDNDRWSDQAPQAPGDSSPRKDDVAESFPLCRHLLWASESRGDQPSGKGLQRWEKEEAKVTLGNRMERE